MNNRKLARVVFLIVLLLGVTVIAKHLGAMAYDRVCFTNWASFIFTTGLPLAYTNTGISDDYMPLFQYVLYLYDLIAGDLITITSNIGYLKGVVLLFDFIGIWYIYKWIDKKTDYLILLIVSIFNLGFSYDTMIWGQIDGIYCAMSFIAVYYAYNNKILVSFLWLILSFNTKLQTIIITPLIGLLYLYWLVDKKRVSVYIGALLLGVVLQLLILLPFLRFFPYFWEQVTGSFARYQWVGESNFWSFIVPYENWRDTDTTIMLWGMSRKTIGLLMFSVSMVFTIAPLVRTILQRLWNKTASLPPKEVIWIMGCLSALCFYYFNTEMHERYSHLTLLFMTAYAFYTRDYLPYIVYSIIYFLVLERGMQWMGLNNYETLIFLPTFKSVVFGLLIIYLFVKLYKLSIKSTGIKRLQV